MIDLTALKFYYLLLIVTLNLILGFFPNMIIDFTILEHLNIVFGEIDR